MAFSFQKGKYGASWVTAPDGTKFASKGEFARWNFLCDMQACGNIKDLRRQIKFNLEVNGQKICGYIADFGYKVVVRDDVYGFEGAKTKMVQTREVLDSGLIRAGMRWEEIETIEDYKGMETPEFKLKKKLMLAIHGIDIHVVKKPTASYK